MNILDQLKAKGLVKQTTSEDLKIDPNSTIYCGFDPTAESLHVGSLVPLITMKYLASKGVKVIGLVGGATAMIGDPSGKSKERNILSPDVIARNIIGISNQVKDISSCQEIVNNHDWMQGIGFLEFLRDVGKHFNVNTMMTLDSVQSRLNGNGISFTEFAYSMIQAKDFCHLYKEHDCHIQMGGSDQWGNMVSGIGLIRKKLGKQAHAFTLPLFLDSDGKKFGKTADGNTIWLSRNHTSVDDFYNFWCQTSDTLVDSCLRMFTLLEGEEVDRLVQEKSPRELQRLLAYKVTALVHGNASALSVKIRQEGLRSASKPQEIGKVIHHNEKTVNLFKVFSECGFVKSRSEFRRLCNQNGIKVDGNLIKHDETAQVPGVYTISRGKKKIMRVECKSS